MRNRRTSQPPPSGQVAQRPSTGHTRGYADCRSGRTNQTTARSIPQSTLRQATPGMFLLANSERGAGIEASVEALRSGAYGLDAVRVRRARVASHARWASKPAAASRGFALHPAQANPAHIGYGALERLVDKSLAESCRAASDPELARGSPTRRSSTVGLCARRPRAANWLCT